MREVYSKAAFCIAATSADSADTGLFFDRDSQQLTPIVVEIPWSKEYLSSWPLPGPYLFGFHSLNLSSLVNSSTLNRRAWVAQERFLSPRILHFTREVLAWECHESYTHENYAKTSVDTSSIDKLLDPSSLKRILNSIRWQGSDIESILNSEMFMGAIYGRHHSDSTDTLVQNTMYQAWGQFLHDYSGDNLTKESDIFVALSGVAEDVGHAMRDRLVAGLWELRFIEDLCWQSTTKCRRPAVWRAPSWSWASTTGPICSAAKKRQKNWTNEIDRLPYYLAVKGKLDIKTKPSGEIEHASVYLECRLIPASICFAPNSSSGIAWCTLDESKWPPSMAEAFTGKRPNARPFGAFVIGLDDPDEPQHYDHRVIDVQVLPLLQRGGPVIYPPRETEGLCIVESTRHPGAFERIGSFSVHAENAMSIEAVIPEAKAQWILLV